MVVLMMNNLASLNKDRILSSITVMRAKEEVEYHVKDYLQKYHYSSFQQQQSKGKSSCIDAECRRLMADWCFKVVDRCGFQRESVAFAMSYLDRYLSSSKKGFVDRQTFQLACMTCLYIAIKVNETEAMNPETISQLSRNVFTVQDIERMELDILFTIRWQCHPPTALAFVQHFVELLPRCCFTNQDEDQDIVLELAQIQTELAIPFYMLALERPSSIAFAALLNAIQLVTTNNNNNNDDDDEEERDNVLEQALRTVAHLAAIQESSQDIKRIQNKLHRLVRSMSCNMISGKSSALREVSNRNGGGSGGIQSSPSTVVFKYLSKVCGLEVGSLSPRDARLQHLESTTTI